MKTQHAHSENQQQRPKGPDSAEPESGLNPLYELFLEELADMYNAEQQLITALPKMASVAQSDELRDAFGEHLKETGEQAKRIEEAFRTLDETLPKKKCKAMEGLLAEGKELMDEHKSKPSLDAALIAAAQKVEHYEIASYGTLCIWAQQLDLQDVLECFQQSLEEEKSADEKLTAIAESLANEAAENDDE